MVKDLPRELARTLRRLSVDLPEAISEITIPAFVLGRDGQVRWLNAAALEAFGNRLGEHYSVVVAPEARLSVSKRFSEKVVGTSRTTNYMAPFIGRGGRRFVAEVDSVRLEDHGHVIGVFGVIDLDDQTHTESSRPAHLTPRQHEVLGLLAGGRSTEQIAAQLHLSRETVRNHIRGALRALGAHSRLEAVAQARALGIV